MAKRSFLKPLSAVLAALASASTWAGIKQTNEALPSATLVPPTQPTDAASMPMQQGEKREVVYGKEGELFKFILQRGPAGDVFAHYSHYSHQSHESHSSHSSHRSHYSSRY